MNTKTFEDVDGDEITVGGSGGIVQVRIGNPYGWDADWVDLEPSVARGVAEAIIQVSREVESNCSSKADAPNVPTK